MSRFPYGVIYSVEGGNILVPRYRISTAHPVIGATDFNRNSRDALTGRLFVFPQKHQRELHDEPGDHQINDAPQEITDQERHAHSLE